MRSPGRSDRTPVAAPELESRVRHSSTFSGLVRVGLVGYGVLHLLVAWLSIRVVVVSTARGGGHGAFAELADQPPGVVALTALAGGLGILAVWQALAAAVGYREDQGVRRAVM